MNDWTLNPDSRNNVDVAFFDFAKAFDSVNHARFITKLERYGIGGQLLRWLAYLLRGRSFRV